MKDGTEAVRRYFFQEYPFSLSGKGDAVDVWVPIMRAAGEKGELAIGVIDWLHSPALVNRAAQVLAGRLVSQEFDFLLSIETQAIPLIHVLASSLSSLLDRDIPYLVCRKEVKAYMEAPLVERYRPAMAKEERLAVLDGRHAQRLRGSKVVLVDVAVISGQTMEVLEKIVKRAGGEVVCRAAVVARGGYSEGLVALQTMPLLTWSEERGAWMEAASDGSGDGQG